MDDAIGDIELPIFRVRNTDIDGTGIRVAVLDSGIDLLHPWLRIAESISICGESETIPGSHGTHVAGIIASRDSVYGGVAPGVDLLNVKVLEASGRGLAAWLARGIDAALDLRADLLCLSVGFNHLPTWSSGGHGWVCKDGRCQLCLAVTNAVSLDDGVIVVAATGNEHEKAEFLRSKGYGDLIDSEIACPSASAQAIAVGALTKQTFLVAPFSSRGPTSFALSKPDIAAPGVNISSSIPARRLPDGSILPGITRGELGGRSSGTSMAAPMVAGIVALILQRRRQAGIATTPADVRAELLEHGFLHTLGLPSEIGVGRLSARKL